MYNNNNSEPHFLGIDVGGSGIKGALVDVVTGTLVGKRRRISTPQPATPKAVAQCIVQLVEHFDYQGPIGCGFPAAIQNGASLTATNIDNGFVNIHVAQLFSQATNRSVKVWNDADVAGMAEMQFGQGKGKSGTVLMLTIGTGIGSALFVDGRLVPNTEFGHVLLHGDIAEKYVSNRTRKEQDLTWETWGRRFDEYLHYINRLLYPNLIILGGGVSKKFDLFAPYFTLATPIVSAQLRNQAGIIGAAVGAAQT